MPTGFALSKQTAQAILEYTLDLEKGSENENFKRRHKRWINTKSAVEFLTGFTTVMTRCGADIQVLNDELCSWLTCCIMEDVDPAWYDRRDTFYIAHNYYQYVTDGAVSPFHDTNEFSIIGDLFNNFPLTTAGKLAADDFHQLIIDELQGLCRGVCVTLVLQQENI